MHSRVRSGTRSSSAPSALIEPTSWRGAPFGVPVVPLVSITIVGFSAATGTGSVRLAAISSSSVASAPPAEPSSVQARKWRSAHCGARSSYSSSKTSVVTRSRSQTSSICGPANSVFMNTDRRPAFAAA